MTPEELERALAELKFAPRASLGPELLGRWRQGERAPDPSRPRRWWVGVWMAACLVLGVAVARIATAPEFELVDRCCQDLDGGGPADDGLLVEVRDGRTVRALSIYEDADGSGHYSDGDTIRFRRGADPLITAPLDSAMHTQEFCCIDYDGGGPSDDALIVVRRPPDFIAMAAIYEWANPEARGVLR